MNSAAIIFDYNQPVITNEVIHIIKLETSDEELMERPKTLVYPNPFSNETNLVFYLEHSAEVYLAVHNLIGKTLERKVISLPAGNNRISIDLSEAGSGLYFLSVKTAAMSFTRKIVKQ